MSSRLWKGALAVAAFVTGYSACGLKHSFSEHSQIPVMVQAADPSVRHRRELMEEALRRDERINGGHFSTYNVRVGTNVFNVAPLVNREGFRIYQDVLDDDKKVKVDIGLDSSVRMESGKWEDFNSNAVLRYAALRTWDKISGALLKQQEERMYKEIPAYQRLKALVTSD